MKLNSVPSLRLAKGVSQVKDTNKEQEQNDSFTELNVCDPPSATITTNNGVAFVCDFEDQININQVKHFSINMKHAGHPQYQYVSI